jgi:hypothetical protein
MWEVASLLWSHSRLWGTHRKLRPGDDHSHWLFMLLGNVDGASVCSKGCAVFWIWFILQRFICWEFGPSVD